MYDFCEHMALKAVGLVLTVVLWPFVVLSIVADALSYIDPKLEGI